MLNDESNSILMMGNLTARLPKSLVTCNFSRLLLTKKGYLYFLMDKKQTSNGKAKYTFFNSEEWAGCKEEKKDDDDVGMM